MKIRLEHTNATAKTSVVSPDLLLNVQIKIKRGAQMYLVAN